MWIKMRAVLLVLILSLVAGPMAAQPVQSEPDIAASTRGLVIVGPGEEGANRIAPTGTPQSEDAAPAKGAVPDRPDGPRVISVVIGNSQYETLPDLKNTANDARATAAAFRDLGHEVVEIIDGDRAAILRSLESATPTVLPGDTVVFYYAGHGVASGGDNHLIPADFTCDADCSNADLRSRTVTMRSVIETLHVPGTIFIGIFDACRDNPFDPGATGGLAADSTSVDTLVAYATAPGAVALDGVGENSPFTGALVGALRHRPVADLRTVLTQVRSQVVQETAGMQVPFTVESLSRPVSLDATTGATSVPEVVEQKPAPVSVRLLGTLAFEELGPTPDRTELVTWLQEYESVPELSPLAEKAYARLNVILVAGMQVDQMAAATPSLKGGAYSRSIEPPADSVLAPDRTRKALIIGINDYGELDSVPSAASPLADLKYAEADANSFAGVLRSGVMKRVAMASIARRSGVYRPLLSS